MADMPSNLDNMLSHMSNEARERYGNCTMQTTGSGRLEQGSNFCYARFLSNLVWKGYSFDEPEIAVYRVADMAVAPRIHTDRLPFAINLHVLVASNYSKGWDVLHLVLWQAQMLSCHPDVILQLAEVAIFCRHTERME